MGRVETKRREVRGGAPRGCSKSRVAAKNPTPVAARLALPIKGREDLAVEIQSRSADWAAAVGCSEKA